MKNIHYKNKEKFQKTLETLKSDWFEKLHILADFDRTMTKSFINGEKKPSIISVLRDEWYLSEVYRKEAKDLYTFYSKFENDNSVSREEKSKYFYEWWRKHLKLLVDSWLSKKDIESVSNSWNIQLRAWIKKFLGFLDEKNIPLVIMSANWLWKDSISLYLQAKWFLTKNIYIISNSFIWDENGKAIWYDERVIHTFNKGEGVLKDYPEIYETVEKRTNVILLGDSLWDPDMIDGFDYDNCIKIGFLNEKEEELLDVYLEKYDVVLTGDDGDFINEILSDYFLRKQ